MVAPGRFSALSPLLLLVTPGMLRARASTCPGTVQVRGHGPVSLVNAEWDMPGRRAGNVRVFEGGSVVPHMRGRTYFADDCTAGTYNYSQYTSMKLLDKTFRYTVDLSLAGCGCNAALYLTPLKRNSLQSDCNDYYCDANKVCGVACSEIDIQEANVWAWHSTLHAWDDGGGVGVGIGGQTATWTKAKYGPGAECVDTLRPFQVAVSFPVGSDGKLRAMRVELSQAGQKCQLSEEVGSYQVKGRNGMAELSEALAGGMTPIISYWSSDQMLWLDGGGPNRLTDCSKDVASNCAPSVVFYGFSLEDYRPPTDGCERCPVGSCHRTPAGECHWFDAPYLKGIHSYHCKVEACSQIPRGPAFSKCWSWLGRHFYSISDRNQPCKVSSTPIAPSFPPVAQSSAPTASTPSPGAPKPEGDNSILTRETDNRFVLNQTLDVVHSLMMAESGSPLPDQGSHHALALLVTCLVGALIGIPAAVVALRRAGRSSQAVGHDHVRLLMASAPERCDVI